MLELIHEVIFFNDLKPHMKRTIANTPIMVNPSTISRFMKFPANNERAASTAYENGLTFARS